MFFRNFLFFGLIALCLNTVNSVAAESCDDTLHSLIVSNIPEDTTFPYTYRNDKSLLTDLRTHENGLYDVYVKAKRFGLTVTIDTVKNAIYYGDDKNDPSKYWKVSPDSVKSFASQCFKDVVPGHLDVSELPISIYDGNPHGWPECEGQAHPMNHCGLKFHEYTKDQLDPSMSKQVDGTLKYFLKLPSLSDLTVLLGTADTNDGYVYVLYVFKNGAMITKEVIAKKTNKTILNFDIYKDYSIHQILQNQVRPETENDTGMDFKEIYEKLDASGKLLKCTKLNVGCK